MKITANKSGWQLSSKNSNLYIDPKELVKVTKDKQVIVYTIPNAEIGKKDKEKFVINCEGRFEVGDFFVEGLFINKERKNLAYYIAVEDMRFLYVGHDLNGKGEDSQEKLGKIDVLVIRPQDDTNLDLTNDLISHYDPSKVMVLLDQVSQEKIDKVCKHFAMSKEEISQGLSLKQKDILGDGENVDAILVSA